MASFVNCIEQALQAGRISRDIAERLKAADDVEQELNNIVATLSRQKREAAIAAVRVSTAWENISTHPEGHYEGLLSLLSKDRTNKAGYSNVEYLQKFYESKYHAKMADMLQRFRSRRLGFWQDEDGLKKLIRAIYGEQVDDAQIMKFADDWHKLNEEMRVEFNQKGGSIGKNERYLMPQHHDARAVQKVGVEKWKTDILPKLDTRYMLDDAGQPLSGKQLDDALNYVYETITSGGLNKTQDLTVPRLGKKLARKHSERRFLYFKDAQSWIEYQRDYGRGDVFGVLTGHINTMAHDLGLMEVLGPSPESTFKTLLAQTEKTTQLKGIKKSFLNAIYNNVSGKVNSGELTTLADIGATTRNIIISSTLGRAFLSALSDLGFEAVTSKYNNIPAFKVLKRHMSLMTNEQQQVFAVKMGLMAENMIGRMHRGNRYADIYGSGASAKVAEGVMRASLLEPWTDAGRKAFGMEFSSMLAENFGKQFDELDSNLLRAFTSYGIERADWDAFRKSIPMDYNGAKFADLTQPNGKKFHQMILSETDYAIPTPDAKVRAVMNAGLGRATASGQIWRQAMLFKSFPATIVMTHFYRMAYQATYAGKLKYLAAITTTTTVLGGIALQMKDISSGRDPRPMDNKEFLAAAIMQGGGLGIFGDFVFSDQNRFGGGLTQTLTGPTGELVDTAAKYTIGNIQEAVRGEETNILGETAQLIDRYTPDVWQTTLFSNAVFDQIELMADPKAQKRFNRIVRRRRKEYGQDFWWRPGEIQPDRPPDLSNFSQ